MEEISLAAMLAAKRSAGVTPEVNLKEHVTHTHTPRGDIHKSPEQDYQWLHKKGPTIFF